LGETEKMISQAATAASFSEATAERPQAATAASFSEATAERPQAATAASSSEATAERPQAATAAPSFPMFDLPEIDFGTFFVLVSQK
jgi:hypothetical protein